MAIGMEAQRDGRSPVDQLLPLGQTVLPKVTPTEHGAPADSGSFLIDDDVRTRHDLPDDQLTGREFMIRYRDALQIPIARQMPTDAETGLPYAILPVDLPSSEEGLQINYHHHFYNRRHPDLEGNYPLSAEQLSNPEDIPFPIIAGLAVRISRGQLLPLELHNLAHKRYPVGPDLPHTVDEKFLTAVKACSGVVSRFALDVTAPEGQQLMRMDEDMFNRVASPKVLCTERVYYDKPANHRRRILGNFFLRYAVKQDLSHISEKRIDEFLHTQNDAARLAVGNFILREAMEVGLAPVKPIVRGLKAQGMVQPGRPDVSKVVWKYVHPNRRERVFRVLREQLLAAV